VPIEAELGLDETERTLPIWLDMIKNAQSSIEIECFYVSNKPGEPLDEVLSAIKKAANRGIKVRFLIDANMKKTYPEPLDKLNKLENIEVKAIGYFNQLGGVMHAKYMIVDRKELFIGSQNFDWRAFKHIHEIEMRISNEQLVQMFGFIFDLDWEIAASNKMAPVESYFKQSSKSFLNSKNPLVYEIEPGNSIELYPTFSPKRLIYPGMAWDEDELVKLMNQAKSEILIQLLSYSVTDQNDFYFTIDKNIRQAAIRGVKVKMILSDWSSSKSKLPYIKSLATIPNIEIHFSSILKWSNGFIPYARVEHCKFMKVEKNTAGWEHPTRPKVIFTQAEI